MKLSNHRILAFSFTFCLVAAVALAGTATAAPDTRVENQSIQSSCKFNVSDVDIGSAPSHIDDSAELVNDTTYTERRHFASEDWIALRLPKSNSSNCLNEAPVGNNLAYATPATPGENTTHTIAPQINSSIANVKQITIEYEIRPSINDSINKSNISLLGIDENKDGFVERTLNEFIDYITVPDSNTIQLSLDGNTTIPSDSYLIVRYNSVSNPEYVDIQTVETTIEGNRTEMDSGVIKYGSNATGLIGSNVDLSITKGRSELVTLRPSTTVVTNDSLYLFLPTDSNLTRPQEYSIAITERSRAGLFTSSQSPYVVENLAVFERYAYTFSNAEIENKTITIKGYTNLAPGSQLAIQVFDRGRLREVGTTVDESQTWSVNVTLPDELLDSTILRTSVLDGNRKEIDQSVLLVR